MRQFFIILIMLLGCSGTVSANVTSPDALENLAITKQIEVLQQQNDASSKHLSATEQKLRRSLQENETMSAGLISEAKMREEIASADVSRLQEALQDNQQNRLNTELKIRHVQEEYQKWQVSKFGRDVVKEKLNELQEQLSGLNERLALLDLYTKTLKTATQNSQLNLQIYENYNSELHKQQELLLQKRRITRLQKQTQQNQDEQQAWIHQLQEQIQISTNDDESLSHKINAQSKIFYLQERIKFSKVMVNYQQLQENLTDLFSESMSESSLQTLESEIPQVKAYLSDMSAMMDKVTNNEDLIAEHKSIVTRSLEQGLITKEEAQSINSLFTELENIQANLIKDLEKLQRRMNTYHQSLQTQVSENLALRNGLPGFNVRAWGSIVSHFLDFPTSGAKFIDSLSNTIGTAFTQMQNLDRSLLLIAEGLLVLFAQALRYLLGRLISAIAVTRSRKTVNALYIATQLLWRNYWGIVLLAGFLILVRLTSIPFKFYSTIIYLALVWFGFHALIGLTRLVLLERVSDASGRDVELYYRLKWVLICGGVITGATVLAHQLFLHYTVLNVMDRLMTLFLLAVALVLLKGRDVLPTLMAPYIDQRRVYLQHAITLLSWLIPFSLLSNAVVGLVGYISLAATISYYQLIFVMAVTLYVVTRGLFSDSLDILSEWAIRHFQGGWLVTEAILKPADRIIRLFLLSATVLAALSFMGVKSDSVLVNSLISVLYFPWFRFSGGNITFVSTIAFIAFGSFILWAGRWSRELAYRWLFRNQEDLAARKSFSAFVQYGVLTIGMFLSLRVLGIDFTGMAVIFGGLAVGLGLGLKDFVSNIISGILMLIERPVREGDLISLDNFEGEVTHIGIRAMRVRSWGPYRSHDPELRSI